MDMVLLLFVSAAPIMYGMTEKNRWAVFFLGLLMLAEYIYLTNC